MLSFLISSLQLKLWHFGKCNYDTRLALVLLVLRRTPENQ